MRIREATQVINYLESGELAQALTEEMNRVVGACQDAAGPKRTAKGSVSLKIEISVQGVHVSLIGHVSGVTPKAERASTLLFVGEDGALMTEHPRQLEMFPRQVPRDDGTVGAEPSRLLARLRYRKAESRIVWLYQLYRADEVLREELERALAHAGAETELPAYEGAPEI